MGFGESAREIERRMEKACDGNWKMVLPINKAS
jgi:hypothetical protein